MSGRGRLIVVRPEPGNARTLIAARAAGFAAEAMPLFVAVPVAWTPPDPADHDALLLTSANAVRHGGEGLARLLALPVVAVGEATAAAARAAGFAVALTGAGDAETVAGEAARLSYRRLLHLGGRERVAVAGVAGITVYASAPLPPPADVTARLNGATVLLHSARAARAVATLVGDRAQTALVAISPAVLVAAGLGWRAAVAAPAPSDAALLAAAGALAVVLDD